ncbi:MAG: DUF2088 domain-containing protein [Acidimicrobiia bacterium]
MTEPSDGFAALLEGVRLPFDPSLKIPELHRVLLSAAETTTVDDVGTAVERAVTERFTGAAVGATVAVGAGSRGLTGRVEMLAGAIRGLRAVGAEPFVVPAMGSHGGAVAEGQLEVLRDYGITEDTVGAEIRATMETVEIASTAAGMRLFLDTHAAAADFIFPVNRVKPHTCFQGPIESGLTKMSVVGFGKQPGAAQIHSCGPVAMRDRLLDGIAALRGTGRLLGGVATIENAGGAVVKVAALDGSEIGAAAELELTELAKSLVPRLPFDEIDVLIVERMGKDISGVGFDPNVTGRYWVHGLEGDAAVATIVVLGLTDASHGNALGIGLADFTTVAVARQIDWQKTYVNCFTAGPAGVRRSRMPMVLPSDEDAVKAALSMCGRAIDEPKRVVRIRSTLHLDELWVSAVLLDRLPAGVTPAPR